MDPAAAGPPQEELRPLSWVRVLALGVCLLGTGTVSFRYLPGLLNDSAPGSPWVNAFYCSAITLTTYVCVCFWHFHHDRSVSRSYRRFICTLSDDLLSHDCDFCCGVAESGSAMFVPGS
jgi:hypothetical protein